MIEKKKGIKVPLPDKGIKSIHEKPTDSITLNADSPNIFLNILEQDKNMHSQYSTQHCPGGSSQRSSAKQVYK